MNPLSFETLIARQIQQESGGNPNAVSPAGAAGLMQIMPGTARDPGFGLTPMPWDQRFNPDANKAFGTAYMRAMLSRYDGDQERALVAYNWGPGNADKWSGDRAALPAETQGYLSAILGGTGVPVAPAAAQTAVPPSSPNPAPFLPTPSPTSSAPVPFAMPPTPAPRPVTPQQNPFEEMLTAAVLAKQQRAAAEAQSAFEF